MRLLLIFLLLPSLFASAFGQTTGHRRKLIIDQDSFGPGGSNLQSILMALQAPDVDLLGITVESGDGWRDENVAHLLRMLELIGRTEIKVYPGVTYPLINSPEATKARDFMYGKRAYKGAWTEEWDKYNSANRTSPYHAPRVIPPMREGQPGIQAQSESAVNFMIREVHQFPNEVSIIALGPETNIALAVRLDDDFAALAKELVEEGGSFNPTFAPDDPFAIQVVNTPRSSTNFWFDPEAAHITLHAAWKKITVVPIDATTHTKLTKNLVLKASHSTNKPQTPIQKYFENYANVDFPMWDEGAFAVWLEPRLVIKQDQLAMDVDTNPGGPDYGGTLSWPLGKGPGMGEASVHIIREIDVPALETLFITLIARQAQ